VKNEKLVFLHLSDIHFKSPNAGDPYDLDRDTRNELTIDVERVVNEVGGLTGILITGDIAFGGAKADFDIAFSWLEGLCDNLGCPPSQVYMVPGNHDVDRGLIDNSEMIKLAHREIRTSSPDASDEMIAKFYRDDFAKKALYEPIANYNEFAAKFGCEISAKNPFWHSDLKLNDGSILRLRGLNSALVSDSDDDDGNGRLVLGSFQTVLERQKGVEYVTLVIIHLHGYLIKSLLTQH
jgi:predicted MPP superfamily phosphohydrolase